MRPRLLALVPAFVLIGMMSAQAASIFSDVKDATPFKMEIEGLAASGVITGNPDGTFRPLDPVNRAAMLKMLFKAAGRTPDEAQKGCFPDVGSGSWYESFVCDAVMHGYVQGYIADNSFRPAHPVTRAEALKMTLTVLHLPVPDDWNAGVTALGLNDVSPSQWFARYVLAGYQNHILPVTGQSTTSFSPSDPLSRGEAAAYIWNALHGSAFSSSTSSSSDTSSSQSSDSSLSASSMSSSSLTGSSSSAYVLQVNFPFTDNRNFPGSDTASYRFTITTPVVTDISAVLQSGQAGGIRCILYKLDANGMSTEYYLGFQENSSCLLRVAMSAGDYQLQLQPTVADVSYTVTAQAGKGDGNDGFSQAVHLSRGKVSVGALDSNDLSDWYVFTVPTQTQLTVTLVSTQNPNCRIYPSADVNMASFSGPVCNTSYLYQPGTYYVGVGHAAPRAERETYSISVR